jgi:AmpE protein
VKSAKVVQDILAWVPVRLIGLTYALVGATAKTISVLMQNIVGPLSNEKKLPGIFGLTAIKADVENPNSASLEENKKALAMVLLGTGVWMAVVLILTIIRLA